MKIKIIDERLFDLPPTKNEGDAGMDLRCCVDKDFYLHPGQERLVPSGLAIKPPTHHCGLVVPRSGMGSKGLVIGNLTGVIDESYTGEILIKLWNRNMEGRPIHIKAMERVAQLLIVPAIHYDIEIVSELEETERGNSGFGSSGRV